MKSSRKFVNDVGIVRKYSEDRFKLVALRVYRMKGIEDDKKHTAKGEAGNEEKLSNNIIRTKRRIFDLAMCNPWEWYVTLTLDDKKQDRNDLQKYIKDLGQFVRNYKRKNNVDIKYLLVPELHQKGGWHLHGFFMNIKQDDLRELTLNQKLPYAIRKELQNGRKLYSWVQYSERFGYTCIERIESQEKISSYITKYITKNSVSTIKELNLHSFYASQGLQEPEFVACDLLQKEVDNPAFENEYCAIKWFRDKNEALAYVNTEKGL